MGGRIAGYVLRVLVAACLVVDAVVHLKLAHGYQQAQPGGIGEGTIFRIESVVALIAAVWVLVRGSRPAFGLAFLVGLSAVAAAVLYRYVNVPSFGPIPSMYEPVWFTKKTVSAVAEAAAAVLALVALVGLGTPSASRGRRVANRDGD
jgi:hypothetical protein